MTRFTSTIATAVDFLYRGGIVALPTEGVYGLSCSPLHLETIERLCQIKNRDPAKGLILVASDISQLMPYIETLNSQQQAAVSSTWPGPVTWLVPVKPTVSTLIHGTTPTIAVRVTSHPLLKEVCQQLGSAIISTSANRSAEAPALSPDDVNSIFSHHEIDYILDGPLGDLKGPTEIRDLKTLKIVRGAA